MEYRWAEFRRKGRTIAGVAMPYGDVATLPFGRETVLPGAFDYEDVILDVMHDRRKPLARFPGAGLTILDDAVSLRISADIPDTRDGNDALTLVDRGILRGLSVEFAALRERQDGDLRVIESAHLAAIGLADRPAYTGTTVEVRRRIGRLSGRVPYNRKLACACKRGCKTAEFKKGSLKQVAEGEGEILAIKGEFKDAIGSKKQGTLRLTDTDEGLEIAMDVPDSTAGADLATISGDVRLLGRPVWDETTSEFEVVNGNAVITKADVRAILVGASDADQGWEPLVYSAAARPQRRARVWL